MFRILFLSFIQCFRGHPLSTVKPVTDPDYPGYPIRPVFTDSDTRINIFINIEIYKKKIAIEEEQLEIERRILTEKSNELLENTLAIEKLNARIIELEQEILEKEKKPDLIAYNIATLNVEILSIEFTIRVAEKNISEMSEKIKEYHWELNNVKQIKKEFWNYKPEDISKKTRSIYDYRFWLIYDYSNKINELNRDISSTNRDIDKYKDEIRSNNRSIKEMKKGSYLENLKSEMKNFKTKKNKEILAITKCIAELTRKEIKLKTDIKIQEERIGCITNKTKYFENKIDCEIDHLCLATDFPGLENKECLTCLDIKPCFISENTVTGTPCPESQCCFDCFKRKQQQKGNKFNSRCICGEKDCEYCMISIKELGIYPEYVNEMDKIIFAQYHNKICKGQLICPNCELCIIPQSEIDGLKDKDSQLVTCQSCEYCWCLKCKLYHTDECNFHERINDLINLFKCPEKDTLYICKECNEVSLKTDGCDHMTCNKGVDKLYICKYDGCFLCMEERKTNYGHICKKTYNLIEKHQHILYMFLSFLIKQNERYKKSLRVFLQETKEYMVYVNDDLKKLLGL